MLSESHIGRLVGWELYLDEMISHFVLCLALSGNGLFRVRAKALEAFEG